MKIIFEHPQTGETKEAPVGFSWTMLFFGVFVPLFRGDFKWALITFLAAIVTFGISWFVFPFIYNKLYIKDLLSKGFKVKDVIGGDITQAERKQGLKLSGK
jgi:hypothetical protein